MFMKRGIAFTQCNFRTINFFSNPECGLDWRETGDRMSVIVV